MINTDEGLAIYETFAADADVSAADVDRLCDIVFELVAEVRRLRDASSSGSGVSA